jgi:CBS-domain-containing membrane protein
MIPCRDIMKREIECLSPRESAQTAAERMRERNIGFLPICDDGMTVLGTVTDRDLALRIVAERRSAATPVEQIMTREVVACYPQDSIEVAKELMADHRKSRIMCVDDDGALLGVISLSDIAKLEGDGAGRTLRAVSQREVRDSPY